jgi:citrate lyase subunit beta/citryl-CoA lyase
VTDRRWEPPGPAILFCPADRPNRFTKAAIAADAVILDLEDGVSPSDKMPARNALQQTTLDPTTTIVRINPSGTEEQVRDVQALAGTEYDVVMLAKAETAAQVRALSPLRVIALIETPRGAIATNEVAAAGAVAVMWGAEDLVAGLGGRSSRVAGGRFRDVAMHARSAVLLAARALDIPAIDSVFLDISDPNGLAHQAEDAAGSGVSADACIHPSQVDVVRAAFRPTLAKLEWTHRVHDAARGAAGVFVFDGRMVDVSILRYARRVIDQSNG